MTLIGTHSPLTNQSPAFRDAQRGDVKQQALLGQMLNEGYGCEKDQAAAAEWTDRAKKRGYKMDGVYCKLWILNPFTLSLSYLDLYQFVV